MRKKPIYIEQFTPDYAVPLGETLLETIEYIGMSQDTLSELTGIRIEIIKGIIEGKVKITVDIAKQFERVLGASASFWVNLENNYQNILRIKEEK